MRYIVTGEEMKSIDSYATVEMGLHSLMLMERAALAVTQVLIDYIVEMDIQKPEVLIVAESGNNGGDGLAMARMLHEYGCNVHVYQVGAISRETAQYRQQRWILDHLDIPVKPKITEADRKEWENKRFDIIVDAIFGVGLKRDLKSPHKEIIETMNRLSGLKCAVDIPTGLDSTTGRVLGTAFQADLTVTFGSEKLGMLFGQGPIYCGDVLLADIGFPKRLYEIRKPRGYTYEPAELNRVPIRMPNGNKGTFGKVVIVAGSEAVCGAAILSGESAYRSGCGLVRIITHINNREAIQERLPEALLQVYTTAEEAMIIIEHAQEWADVMIVGPGIGTEKQGIYATLQALKFEGPVIIDADAINILSRQPEWSTIPKENRKWILTPHMKEMERISGIPMQDLKVTPWEHAVKFATENHVVCVMKDATTIVAEPESDDYYINTSGNDGMATGGSGDALTGIIAGMLAQGMDLAEAARIGVYIHGLAGDWAAEQRGHHSMLASDIIEGVGHVLRMQEEA